MVLYAKEEEMFMMNKYTTEKGTDLFWEVTYDLGGYNMFTGEERPRGYSLSVRRNRSEFGAFSDLTSSTGAVSDFLLEVGRKSVKREVEAMEMVTHKHLQSIADMFGI